jgi:hypothetical protein
MTDLNERAQRSVSRREAMAGSLGMVAAVTLSTTAVVVENARANPLSAISTCGKGIPQ